jgi:translation elongation factor EF-1beta
VAKGNRKRVKKAMRVLEGADADLATLAELSASILDSQAELVRTFTEMQEMQMSFNLQYLQLQKVMQEQSRGFAALSNIMKAKHETVKNTIANIR